MQFEYTGLPELVFLPNRVTPVACWITLGGHRDKPSPSLAAACGLINVGPWLPGVFPFFRIAPLAAGVPVFPVRFSLSMEMLLYE